MHVLDTLSTESEPLKLKVYYIKTKIQEFTAHLDRSIDLLTIMIVQGNIFALSTTLSTLGVLLAVEGMIFLGTCAEERRSDYLFFIYFYFSTIRSSGLFRHLASLLPLQGSTGENADHSGL